MLHIVLFAVLSQGSGEGYIYTPVHSIIMMKSVANLHQNPQRNQLILPFLLNKLILLL